METRGSDCRFRDELSAYVDRALDGGRRRALEQHLPECEACRTELAGFESVDRFVRAHPPEIQASPTFRSGFLAALDAEIAAETPPRLAARVVAEEVEPRGFWSWFAQPVLIPMSAAAVAIAVAVISWPQGTPEEAAVGAVAETTVDSDPIAPKVAAETVEIRPAVAIGVQPEPALASSDQKLPKAIEQVVRDIQATKPADARKLVGAVGQQPMADATGASPPH